MAQRADAQKRSFGPAGMRRRAELMDAAVILSSRQGFAKTRVSDIVGQVGVGQGVFYWYFESKDALFQEILQDTTRRLRLYQSGVIGEDPDPLRRIAKGILASLEFIVNNRHAFALLDHAIAQARWRQKRIEALRVHVLDTARHFEEAIHAGRARDTDPRVLAQGVTGVVDRMARAYLATGGSDVEALAQEAIDFCLAGATGERPFEVDDLRADVVMTPELAALRDTVGSGGVEPDRS